MKTYLSSLFKYMLNVILLMQILSDGMANGIDEYKSVFDNFGANSPQENTTNENLFKFQYREPENPQSSPFQNPNPLHQPINPAITYNQLLPFQYRTGRALGNSLWNQLIYYPNSRVLNPLQSRTPIVYTPIPRYIGGIPGFTDPNKPLVIQNLHTEQARSLLAGRPILVHDSGHNQYLLLPVNDNYGRVSAANRVPLFLNDVSQPLSYQGLDTIRAFKK